MKISPRCSRRPLKPKRVEKGQTVEGTIVAIGAGGGIRQRRRQGRGADRARGTEGCRWRARGRGRRPHSGDGRVDRGRADAFAAAGARRRDRQAARRRVPRRPAGRGQGRTRGEGRLRGAHRPDSAPSVRSRKSTSCGPRTRRSTIGRVYAFRIIEYKEGGRNLIVSRRALLEEEQRANAAEVRRSIVAGAVLTGRVTSVRDFGAFVDLGAGVQGLLHVSEMGWSRVSDPSQVVAAGEEITVKVLRVDDDRQKIALGIEAAHCRSVVNGAGRSTRWARCAPAAITRLAEFGAFVELEPGVEGAGARVHVRADRAARRAGRSRSPWERRQRSRSSASISRRSGSAWRSSRKVRRAPPARQRRHLNPTQGRSAPGQASATNCARRLRAPTSHRKGSDRWPTSSAVRSTRARSNYLPWYFGGRPSASARRPSRKSSVR